LLLAVQAQSTLLNLLRYYHISEEIRRAQRGWKKK